MFEFEFVHGPISGSQQFFHKLCGSDEVDLFSFHFPGVLIILHRINNFSPLNTEELEERTYRPPRQRFEPEFYAWLTTLKRQEAEMRSVIRDMIVYLVYLVIILLISYGNQVERSCIYQGDVKFSGRLKFSWLTNLSFSILDKIVSFLNAKNAKIVLASCNYNNIFLEKFVGFSDFFLQYLTISTTY